MFRILSLLLCFFMSASISMDVLSQAMQKRPAKSDTFALVIGISNYENEAIPSLQYAHTDAAVFAAHLQSKAGGEVPAANIKMLTNEEATVGAIYASLDWLQKTCKQGDVAYFYFSGHGDVETKTIANLGFLLAYNTPEHNYINHAVRIEDINNIANTLAAKKDVKVILITDACHSGKLAGNSIRGNILVGDELRKTLSNEIRITSCGPGELSAENGAWGNGRGVFSYYLINGLSGLANPVPNGIITLALLKQYLEKSFAGDAILRRDAIIQNPVLKGDARFPIARVDSNTLAAIRQQGSSPAMGRLTDLTAGLSTFKSLPIQPMDYFFNLFKNNVLEKEIDFERISASSKELMAFAVIRQIAEKLGKAGQDSLTLLLENMAESEMNLVDFRERFASLIIDRGQVIINAYLQGDVAELEKRSYYSINTENYAVYPKMYDVALSMISPENFLYRMLMVDKFYFEGIVSRLKIHTVPNPEPLIEAALASQKKAYALEKGAAYIQNEMGILYLIRKDYKLAENFLQRATELAPTWAIPWSNLIGLYNAQKNYPKALEAATTAKMHDVNLQNIYVNEGITYEQTNNLLMAEANYMHSIALNLRHYLPFERMGTVAMQTTRYAMADSMFYESEKRKKGFYFQEEFIPNIVQLSAGERISLPDFTMCAVNAQLRDASYVFYLVAVAADYASQNDLKQAEALYRQVLALEPKNFIAYFYLGKLYAKQQLWQSAEISFKYAIEHYQSKEEFLLSVESLAKQLPPALLDTCWLKAYKSLHFSKVENYFLLGSGYEQRGYVDAANDAYKLAGFEEDGRSFGGSFYKRWNLFEKAALYHRAEEVLQEFYFSLREKFNAGFIFEGSNRFLMRNWRGELELFQFYKRMLERYPENISWRYKAGVMLYKISAGNNHRGLGETPKSSVYIDRVQREEENFRRALTTIPALPGINERIRLQPPIDYPYKEAVDYLQKARLMITEIETVAEIDQMLGDLYSWMGLPAMAAAWYKKSVEQLPGNASVRSNLAASYQANYALGDALEQLDSLGGRGQLQFAQQLVFIEYLMYSSQFNKAKQWLNQTSNIHPINQPDLLDLQGRLHLLEKNPASGIPFYKSFIPYDTVDGSTRYNLARLYAQWGRQKEALQWLEEAVNKGFKYKYVMQRDPVWVSYRKVKKWSLLFDNLGEGKDYGD